RDARESAEVSLHPRQAPSDGCLDQHPRNFFRRRGRANACMTWSSSFEARARSAWRPLASFDCSGCPSAGDQRTVALTKWTECFCGGDGGAYLVIIPRVLGFFGPLHLEQVHVVNFAAVETDAAGAEQRIVGR